MSITAAGQNSGKLVCLLILVLGLVCFGERPAQAAQTFFIEDMVRPGGLLAQDILIEPDHYATNGDSMTIVNLQWYQTEIRLRWSYQTQDRSPIYDPASYTTTSGGKQNLTLPQGSNVQNGTLSVVLSAYETLRLAVASDGSGRGGQLKVFVEAVEFPPRLDVPGRYTTLSTGKPADFRPVVLNQWDGDAPYETTFSISPALPQGLLMDVNGRITGTPVAELSATNYRVTGTRLGGSRSVDVTIAVSSAVMADLDAGDVSVRLGGPIAPVRPVVGSSGVQALSYSVAPVLPAGLSMAVDTGMISGTPTALAPSTTYTVTVSDGLTQASKAFALAVLPSASSPIATPETVTWQAGVPLQVNFVLRSDLMYGGVNYKNGQSGSLKDANGAELWGTDGYPKTPGLNGTTLNWSNPIAGQYSGELYIYLEDTYEYKTIPFTLIVTGDKTDQTIAFTSTAPNAVAGGLVYAPAATSSSQLPVQFSIETESNAVCSLATGEVQFLSEGICLLNANQPGDATTNAAPQATQVIQVAKGAVGTELQTVSFTSPTPTPTFGGASIIPRMTASSGLPVELVGVAASKEVCWPDGDKVVLLAAGSCTIRAQQTGNFQFATAFAEQTFTIAEAPVATVAVPQTTLALDTLATAFAPVTVVGGVAPFSYTLSDPLPAGLVFSGSIGVVSGTPTALASSAVFTVTIEDANGVRDTATFSLAVTDGPSATLEVASKALTVGRAVPAFTPVSGTGGNGTLSYAISPTLPVGLQFSAETGHVSGTASQESTSTSYTVTVTDGAGESSSATFSLTVNPTVSASLDLPNASATAGSTVVEFAPVSATGGSSPLLFSVTPALPAGLSLAPSTGKISGSAVSASVETQYTVTVTDANGAQASETFGLTVSDALVASLSVASQSWTVGRQGTAFIPVTAQGGAGALSYAVSPTLPDGLVFDASNGTVSGTATVAAEEKTYTVTVTDANSAIASKDFALTINPGISAVQAVPSKTLSSNIAATSFVPVTASGGTGTLAYAVYPALPQGLSFAVDTGAVSGTASAANGPTTYTVTVTDQNGATGSSTFVLIVNGPLEAIVSAASTSLTLGSDVVPFAPVKANGGTGAITYAVQPSLPAGLTFSSETGQISGTPVVTSAASTYTVTLTDGNLTTDTADFSLTIVTVPTTLVLSANPANPVPGEPVILTATLTPQDASGSITFKNGTNILGVVDLNAGIATLETSSLEPGVHLLTATYAGSVSHSAAESGTVMVSMQTPATEFTRYEAAVRDTVTDVAQSSLSAAVQAAQETVSDATGRLIQSSRTDNVTASTKGEPQGFRGALDARDGQMTATGTYLSSSGATTTSAVRMTMADIQILKTELGNTTINASGRITWEWLSDGSAVGTWLGSDIAKSEVSGVMPGNQSGVTASAGIYGVHKLGDAFYLNAFASLGVGWQDLNLSNESLELSGTYFTHNIMAGGSLIGSWSLGMAEFRPSLGVSMGRTNIGNVGFTATAFGQTDRSIQSDFGAVSQATAEFNPTFLFRSPNYLTQYEVSPEFSCQRFKNRTVDSDCGYGLRLSISRPIANANGDMSVRVEMSHIGGRTNQSIAGALNYRF